MPKPKSVSFPLERKQNPACCDCLTPNAGTVPRKDGSHVCAACSAIRDANEAALAAKWEPDPTVLTDDEADWVLDRLLWLLAPTVNPGAFKAAFGVGCEFGVRGDARDAARAFVRAMARVER
jgi:hypothetical protein